MFKKSLFLSVLFLFSLIISPFLYAEHVTETAPADYLSKANPLKETPEVIAKGTKIYENKCLKCHGKDGDGKGKSAAGLTPPVTAFKADGYLEKKKDGQLFWIIENGSKNTDMDAYGPGTNFNLSHDDIWSVITYIRKKFTPKKK